MKPGDSLSCTDCFAIMDLLLLGAELGLDSDRLQQLALDHLAHCPGCRERLLEQLSQLEELHDQARQSPRQLPAEGWRLSTNGYSP